MFTATEVEARKCRKKLRKMINQSEVYVDDFILMSQCINTQELKCISRRVLHAVHCILPPSKITGHNVEEPISIKIGRWRWPMRL